MGGRRLPGGISGACINNMSGQSGLFGRGEGTRATWRLLALDQAGGKGPDQSAWAQELLSPQVPLVARTGNLEEKFWCITDTVAGCVRWSCSTRYSQLGLSVWGRRKRCFRMDLDQPPRASNACIHKYEDHLVLL